MQDLEGVGQGTEASQLPPPVDAATKQTELEQRRWEAIQERQSKSPQITRVRQVRLDQMTLDAVEAGSDDAKDYLDSTSDAASVGGGSSNISTLEFAGPSDTPPDS